MSNKSVLIAEAIHPALWRASQLASAASGRVSCGYSSLDKELPGGGWPQGCLIEILLAQSGTAELRFLRNTLTQLDGRPVILLQAPYRPQIYGLDACGIKPAQLLWVQCRTHSDELWAAEQILRSGSAGALLFWQTHIRHDALRRLHMAADATGSLFFLIRPLHCGSLPSPAPLRLTLQATAQGVQIQLMKRRGAPQEMPIQLAVPLHPCLRHDEFTQQHLVSAAQASASARAFVGGGLPALASA